MEDLKEILVLLIILALVTNFKRRLNEDEHNNTNKKDR